MNCGYDVDVFSPLLIGCTRASLEVHIIAFPRSFDQIFDVFLIKSQNSYVQPGNQLIQEDWFETKR